MLDHRLAVLLAITQGPPQYWGTRKSGRRARPCRRRQIRNHELLGGVVIVTSRNWRSRPGYRRRAIDQTAEAARQAVRASAMAEIVRPRDRRPEFDRFCNWCRSGRTTRFHGRSELNWSSWPSCRCCPPATTTTPDIHHRLARLPAGSRSRRHECAQVGDIRSRVGRPPSRPAAYRPTSRCQYHDPAP